MILYLQLELNTPQKKCLSQSVINLDTTVSLLSRSKCFGARGTGPRNKESLDGSPHGPSKPDEGVKCPLRLKMLSGVFADVSLTCKPLAMLQNRQAHIIRKLEKGGIERERESGRTDRAKGRKERERERERKKKEKEEEKKDKKETKERKERY